MLHVTTCHWRTEQIPAYFTRKERWDMLKSSGKQATKTFNDVNLGYAESQQRVFLTAFSKD